MACRTAGTLATLQAPLASTTQRHRSSPLSVVMRSRRRPAGRDVTAVCGRTGAAAASANREMNAITSGIVMKPSGSVPS